MSNEFTSLRNPRNVRQEIKFSLFYLIDAAIIAIMVVIANQILKVIPLGGVATVFFYVLFAGFGIFLCMKPFSNPTSRNFKVIWYMLKMDNNNYHPIQTRHISSITKEKR